MRRLRFARLPLAIAALGIAGCGSKSDGAGGATPAAIDAGSTDDFIQTLRGNTSCVFACDPACTEGPAPWACPATGNWSTVPHDPAACGTFDGKTFPALVTGACTATIPSADALAKTSIATPPIVLPDGRRLQPAGNEWIIKGTNDGTFPASSVLVAGTRWLIVVDTGYGAHAIRVVDTSLLRASGATSPLAAEIVLPRSETLNWGVAYVPQTGVVYVASGTPDSKIYAWDLNAATGALTADAGKTIALPVGAFPQGLAASPDGKTLLVGQAKDSNAIYIVSLDAATYGAVKGTIDPGVPDVFEIRFDPNDPTGNTAYASLWHTLANPAGDPEKMLVLQLDVAKARATAIPVGKEPEEMVFLDGRYMVVANGFSDSFSIIDRPAGKVASEVPLLVAGSHGVEPTALAFDAPRKRLYAALSSANAIGAYDVDDTTSPPTLTPAGVFPTAWWPTSITVDPADGTLYVTNGKGHGTGSQGMPFPLSTGTPDFLASGSVEAVPFMDAAALATSTAAQGALTNVSAMSGASTVQCNGAPYDFPVPLNAGDGPSTKIKHIVFVERENKTFDDVFGDVAGVEGDPNYVLAPGHMDDIWPNARTIASTFAHMDNFYEDADQSIQGHYWASYGRTSDYDERRWLVTWGRGEFTAPQAPGVFDDTAPLEGSVMESLLAQGVTVTNMGELVGGFGPFRDTRWPGGSSDTVIPDSPAACYFAAHARVLCDLAQFTYIWIGNDHTFGMSAGKPNPASMIAVNDEATGIILDGISHSPIWPDSLVIVIEDDPSDGSDHVDQHRTLALLASPWIKRNYVSHGHYDMASLHKIITQVFGEPYRNEAIANAALPFDMFTSTPDYTPYTYIPRRYSDITCNPGGTSGSKSAEHWDFDEVDNQPGLSGQVRDYLRSLPPKH